MLVYIAGGVVVGHLLATHAGLEAPWWVWALLTIAVVEGVWLNRAVGAFAAVAVEREQNRHRLQWGWGGGVHFPSFLMRERFEHFFRIYDLRRLNDGTWERRIYSSPASVRMNRRAERLDRDLLLKGEPSTDPDDGSMWDEFDRKAHTWEPFGGWKLETDYQRFIHAQDIFIDDDVAERWMAEAEDEDRKEQAKEDARRGGEGVIRAAP